jgi:hypothetical protein
MSFNNNSVIKKSLEVIESDSEDDDDFKLDEEDLQYILDEISSANKKSDINGNE